MTKYVVPDHISSEEIRLIRDALGMTQKEFAEFAHVLRELWKDGNIPKKR